MPEYLFPEWLVNACIALVSQEICDMYTQNCFFGPSSDAPLSQLTSLATRGQGELRLIPAETVHS